MKESFKVSLSLLVSMFLAYWFFVLLPNTISDKSNLFILWLAVTPFVGFVSIKLFKSLHKK